MNVTTRGKPIFGTKTVYGLLQPYKQKEKDAKGFSQWNSQDDTQSGVSSNY